MLKLTFKQTQAEIMVRAASTVLFNQLIRAGYPCVSLSQLAEDPQYGYTASAEYENVGPKFVRITDLKDGSIDWASVPYCKCDTPASYLLLTNDILFARTGATTGKTHLVKQIENAIFASYLIRLRPKLNVLPSYLYSFFQSDIYWSQILEEKEGSAQPNVNGKKLINLQIPLANSTLQAAISNFLEVVRARQDGSTQQLPELPPPIAEQRRIVARVEELAGKVEEARGLRSMVEKELYGVLLGAYREITENAPKLPMSQVAPLVRRSVEVDVTTEYPELGVRSFGKGTFHKTALSGLEVGSKKLFVIASGDLLFQIVFAWEGAIAIAKPEDEGRFGSHRFLTCVPTQDVATAEFLCFHFLTEEGLEDIGKASPGGAGRNRTLGLEALAKLEVPVPSYEKQLWFSDLLARVNAIRCLRSDTEAGLNALLPSILDKAFKGEL